MKSKLLAIAIFTTLSATVCAQAYIDPSLAKAKAESKAIGDNPQTRPAKPPVSDNTQAGREAAAQPQMAGEAKTMHSAQDAPHAQRMKPHAKQAKTASTAKKLHKHKHKKSKKVKKSKKSAKGVAR